MQYRYNQKNKDKISALGFGIMRLPQIGKEIDEEETIKLIKCAYESGINYFDTAYIYLGGKSEEILGRAVKDFRDKIFIADKLPIHPVKKYEDFDMLFNTSLKRLQTDYIDYYLIHCILSSNQYKNLVDLGINKWINEKKKSGEIKNIGFSFPGKRDDFKKIIDSYDWDFTQIQYNFLDINYQAGKTGLAYAYGKGIPIIIMEPLRGGAIVNSMPKKAKEIFEQANSARTLADWGLRWVYNHKEVLCVLSGMSSKEQLEQNIETTKNAFVDSLTQDDFAVYDNALEVFNSIDKINCTGCGYCLPCPAKVDIPSCFAVYNNRLFHKTKLKGLVDYITTTGSLTNNPGNASLCVECGKCEKNCPQHLEIRQELKKVKRKLEVIPLFNFALKLPRRILNKKYKL